MSAAALGWSRAVSAAAVALGLDQATKAWARASLDPDYPLNVFFGIDLSLVRNRGIAFGVLDGASELAILGITAAALLLLLLYFSRHPTMPHLWLPVGAVLGGAAGNLLDRAREGAVTDFIDPAFWPAFNLADAMIVLGVLGVLYVGEPDRTGPRRAGGSSEEEPARPPTGVSR